MNTTLTSPHLEIHVVGYAGYLEMLMMYRTTYNKAEYFLWRPHHCTASHWVSRYLVSRLQVR